ncbi:MAG: 50S ribosomal protein L24 [Thermoplasmata archaeon]|nr:50S ribosomal protein L24 [Thermoplasmata archaeon]
MVMEAKKRTSSKQPRKQRKARYNAPKNRRRKMMASPLSRELREKQEYYPRRMTVRKGDVVRVTRGGYKGHEGKIIGVNLKKMNVTIDGMTYQKADGKSVPKPIDPSNIEIIKLDLSDRRRKKKFERILSEQRLSEEEMREAQEEIEVTESIGEGMPEEAIEEEEEAESTDSVSLSITNEEEGKEEEAEEMEEEMEEREAEEKEPKEVVVERGEEEVEEEKEETDEEMGKEAESTEASEPEEPKAEKVPKEIVKTTESPEKSKTDELLEDDKKIESTESDEVPETDDNRDDEEKEGPE